MALLPLPPPTGRIDDSYPPHYMSALFFPMAEPDAIRGSRRSEPTPPAQDISGQDIRFVRTKYPMIEESRT